MRRHVIARFGRLMIASVEVAVLFCPFEGIGPNLGQLLNRRTSGILQVEPVKGVP